MKPRRARRSARVPLDNRLQLPWCDFSYLLQDWDQSLVEQVIWAGDDGGSNSGPDAASVDGLEHMNQEMAGLATTWCRPSQRLDEGKSWSSTTARDRNATPSGCSGPGAHRTKGDKASRKRMVIAGTVYSVWIATGVRPRKAVAAVVSWSGESPGASARPQNSSSRAHHGRRGALVRERNWPLPGWWRITCVRTAARTSRCPRAMPRKPGGTRADWLPARVVNIWTLARNSALVESRTCIPQRRQLTGRGVCVGAFCGVARKASVSFMDFGEMATTKVGQSCSTGEPEVKCVSLPAESETHAR